VELYLHSSNTPSWRGAQLKLRDNFTFYLLYTYNASELYQYVFIKTLQISVQMSSRSATRQKIFILKMDSERSSEMLVS